MKYLYRVIGVLVVVALLVGALVPSISVSAQTAEYCHPSYKVEGITDTYYVDENDNTYYVSELRCVYDQNVDRGGLSRRQWCIQSISYPFLEIKIQQDGDIVCFYDLGTHYV